jgi:hypothetical protein
LVNRVTIHGKAGQSKEVTLDYAVADEKIEDDTDFDPEKVSQTVKLGLPIPVRPFCFELMRKLVALFPRDYSMLNLTSRYSSCTSRWPCRSLFPSLRLTLFIQKVWLQIPRVERRTQVWSAVVIWCEKSTQEVTQEKSSQNDQEQTMPKDGVTMSIKLAEARYLEQEIIETIIIIILSYV